MLGASAVAEAPVSGLSAARMAVMVGEALASSLGSTALHELLRDRDRAIDYAAEIAVRMIATDAQGMIYAATRELITLPGEVPANQPFLGTLAKAANFDRSIVNGDRIGQATIAWGELELMNIEGDYDALIGAAAVDGQRVTLKVAPAGAPYGSFWTLFSGTAKDWDNNESVLRVVLRDNSVRLDVPAQPLVYAGTGGPEGTADLKGKRKPLALGDCENATPAPVEPVRGLYQAHGGAVRGFDAVYDDGVPLRFVRDYPSSVTLRTATTGALGSGADIEAGGYATCLAQGLFRLGALPAGTVTCSVRGDATGGVYAETTATIIRRLVLRATDLTASDLAAYTFDAVEQAQSGAVGYFLEAGAEASVADVVADLMGTVGGWGGMRRDGRFELGIFTAPSGTPTAYYDAVEIDEDGITRERLPDGLSPPPWRFRVGWGRNFTVQSEVLPTVGTDRAAFVAQPIRLVTSDAARGQAILADHPLAQDPAPIESWLVEQNAAQAEADRLLALYGEPASLYRIRLKVHPFLHDVGEVIFVTYPRWGLANGRLLRIVATSDDTSADQLEVLAFG